MAQIPNTRGNPQATDIAVQSALPFNGSLSREDLQTVLTTIDSDIAKLYEDRNAVLTDGGLITYLGTTVQFTQNLKLELNSLIAGGSPISVSLGSATRTISADGRMIYAVVDRSLGTAVVTDDAATLPAVVSPNKEVFLLAKRSDSGDGVKRLYFRNGMALDEGQTARLGASGSGAGTANETLESLKNQLLDCSFDLLTPNIFSSDEDNLVDISSTGAYNLVDKTFNFAASTVESLISTNMLDPDEFLADSNALAEIELSVYWHLANIDTSAVYSVSRNGGTDWQVVTMERSGSTDLYRGYHRFADTETTTSLTSQLVQNVNFDFSNAINKEIAQEFTISSDKFLLKQVDLYFTKVNSPIGSIYVSICDNNAGSPGNVLVETSAISIPGLSVGVNTITIPDKYLNAGTYFLRVRTDATYKSAFPTNVLNIRADISASAPFVDIYNGTAWFDNGAGKLYYNLKGFNLDLRVKVESSNTAGIKKLEGYGIFYDKSVGNISTGVLNREVFTFSGDANTSSFALTKFVPNPDLLKVYDVTSGQVYTYGAFSLQGQTVVFDAGQFLSPGNTLTLVFDQTTGGAFDNSDLNGLLLSSNHLGSTDATIDKSIAGRGLFLRRPDGTLREICIDDSDNIVIYSV